MNISCLLVLGAISLSTSSPTMTESELSSLIEKKYYDISFANPSLSEEEISKRIIDDIGCENADTVKEQISGAYRNLEKYDYIIGSPFGEIKEIRLGEDETYDFIIYKILSRYISTVCPDYMPENSALGSANVPDPKSETFQNDVDALETALNKNPMTLNEATNLVVSKDEQKKILCSYRSADGLRYYETYDFSKLDELLDKMNEQMTVFYAANVVLLVKSVILGILCPSTLTSTIPINIAAWGVFKAFDSNFLGKLNDYELAVINAYHSIHGKPFIATKMQSVPGDKAKEFFGKHYKNSLGNNTLDAYRHTYWNATMTHWFGDEAAKYMADAHEYGPLKNGEVNTLDEKRAVDMDLMNNEAGRAIGRQYPMHQDKMMRSLKDNLNINADNWDAIGYYTLKFVSQGYCSTHYIYTFASDLVLNDSVNYSNYDSIEGLKNTNFKLDDVLDIEDSYKLYDFNAYC